MIPSSTPLAAVAALLRGQGYGVDRVLFGGVGVGKNRWGDSSNYLVVYLVVEFLVYLVVQPTTSILPKRTPVPRGSMSSDLHWHGLFFFFWGWKG